MSTLLHMCPSPGQPIDWETLTDHNAAWWGPLELTPQDPVYHAEGDVATHTRLVVEGLLQEPAWRELDQLDRAVLFAGALLHDAGKATTTRNEDGRLVSRGHSRVGEILARRVLWQQGVNPLLRERVAALVRCHMWPPFFIQRGDYARNAAAMSVISRCSDLALLCRADARGRTGPDPGEALAAIDVFEQTCAEFQCRDRPFPFSSAHSRFIFFRRPDRNPLHAAHDDTRCTVTVLSGLPASGKTYWREQHPEYGPAVCLDEIRAELAREHGRKAHGMATAVAYERARAHLRDSRDFVWDSTNLSRDVRSRILSLAADYNARTRIVALEVSPAVLAARNTARNERDRVPDDAFDSMLGRWEFPDLTEAHEILVVDSGRS